MKSNAQIIIFTNKMRQYSPDFVEIGFLKNMQINWNTLLMF